MYKRQLSFRPGINEYSIPGYSFYSHDPQECGSMAADLEASGRNQWAAVEWLRNGSDAKAWEQRLRRTLEYKSCRLLSIYNWESFREKPGALDAVREVIKAVSVKKQAAVKRRPAAMLVSS